MHTLLLLILGVLFFNFSAFAQSSFGIGTDTPDANAIFEAQSTDKGILIPRLTTAQRGAIAGLGVAQEGLLIYNTNSDEFNYWNGSAWIAFPTLGTNNTLDQAYDEGGAGAGRQINAFNGAVRVAGSDGFEVTGTINTGASPTLTGIGSKLFFNPRTASFRAGYTTGTHWNAANIGGYSVAMGNSTLASGNSSIALGYYTQATNNFTFAAGNNSSASGQSSTALGNNTTASNAGATSLGRQTTASGEQSIATGYLSVASGDNSMTTGYDNDAIGDNSFAGGYQSSASGNGAFAFGLTHDASGDYSTSLGYVNETSGPRSFAANSGNTASGINSFAIGVGSLTSGTQSFAGGGGSTSAGNQSFAFGREVNANADYSMAFGYYTAVNSYAGGFAVGHFNDPLIATPSINFGSNDPLFMVGNGTSAAALSNAFTVSRFGQVTINDAYTFPNIDGANGYVLQTNGSGTLSWIDPSSLALSDIDFYESGTSVAPNAITDNIYTQGNLGIGETNPSAALHVNGGSIPFRIEISNTEKLRLNNETLEFVNTGGSVFIGLQAGAVDDNSTNDNVAIGQSALTTNTNGQRNVAIGSYSLDNNLSGNFNIGIGYHSLSANTASNNVSIGYFSMFQNTSGTNNIAYGYSPMYNNLTGSQNVALGYQSLYSNTSASDNIGIGFRPLFLNTTGIYNIAIGTEALRNSTADNNNIAIGNRTLYSNDGGISNVAIGVLAIQDNTTGDYNAAIGHQSLSNNTTGSYNVALGYRSLLTNTSGGNNVAIGGDALYRNTTGGNNVGAGFWALYNNTTGTRNIGIGDRALYSNSVSNFNIALGFNTLYNTIGQQNVAIGVEAGYSNTLGRSNIFIGYQAGYQSTTLSNQLYIENSSDTQPLIFGSFSTNEVGINWNTATALPNTLSVNGNASKSVAGAFLANSDSRLKKDIEYLESEAMLDKVLQMKGVTYQWNDDKTGVERPEGVQYGFIAQDLQMVWPTKVSEDGQGYLQTAYGDYDPMFVEAFKAQQAQIEVLKTQNELYANQIEQLNKIVNQLSLSVEQLTTKSIIE